jgi:long-chain acyl-CoA synthetase
MLVGDVPRLNAQRFPGEEAIVDARSGVRLTHSKLNERVNRLANSLLSLGLRKGEKVAILGRSSFRYAEIFLANGKAGLVSVPLNAWFTAKDLSAILNNAEARAIFIEPEFFNDIASIQGELHHTKILISTEGNDFSYQYENMIENGSSNEPPVNVQENDIYLLPYTSGTTAFPKGVLLTHKNIITGAFIHQGLYGLRPGDRFLTGFPFFFSVSLPTVVTPLFSGGCIIVHPFEPGIFVELLGRESITHFSGVPTHYQRIFNEINRFKREPFSLRQIMVAGAPLPIPLLEEMVETFGKIVYQNYGMTETTVVTVSMRPEWLSFDREKTARLQSCGKPVNGLEVLIIDNENQSVPWNSDEAGEVLVKGDTVMKGYWKSPDLNPFWNGWFRTGDMARRDEEGYIYIAERKSDMIISGGINVYPREIEDIISTHPAVEMVAVIGIPDADLGEAVKAIVKVKRGLEHDNKLAASIIDSYRANLASHKKPKSIELVSEMPLSPTGKILKKELRRKYQCCREQTSTGNRGNSEG